MRGRLNDIGSMWVGYVLAIVLLADPCNCIAGGTYRLYAEPNDLRWDLGERFGFVWDSVRVSLERANPSGSAKPTPAENPATLTMSVNLNIVDTTGLLAVDVSNPVVFAALDEDGGPVQWRGATPDNSRHYDRIGVEVVADEHSPATMKMMPSGTIIELSLDPNYPLPSSVSVIKGYLYALCIDKIIEVDIPYDPNGGWVESKTAPDLTLCVDPTTPANPGPLRYEPIPPSLVTPFLSFRSKAVALCEYFTWVKSKSGSPVMALPDASYTPSVLVSVNYVVVETQLFDSKHNRAVRFPTVQIAQSDLGKGAFCHGWPRQAENGFDAIRHVIGVRPVEVKVPFVLANIPVPGLPEAKPGTASKGTGGQAN